MCAAAAPRGGAGSHRIRVPEVTSCSACLVADSRTPQAVAMHPSAWPRLKSLVSPGPFAAVAAWSAVWLATPETTTGAVPSAIVHACLVAFVVIFLLEHLLSRTRQPWSMVGVGSLLAALALVAIAGTPHGPSPILLILVASLFAAHFDWKPLLATLVVMNSAFIAVVVTTWSGSSRTVLVYVLAYLSFQMFAAMVMRAAARAEGMSERLREVNADLLATRGLLAESARDAERLRVARELHDIAGHKLTALKLNLAVLVRDARYAGEPQPRLCAELADELLADLRQLVERMRSEDGIDLRESLAAISAPFPRPRAHIEIGAEARVATLAHAETILRAAQEALTNAARHSQAQNLWIVLRREPQRLLLDMRDDGRGSGDLVPGNGLAGMRERFTEAGGGLRVERLDTGAVHVEAWLPLAA